jgi:hypothetical protein
MTAKQPSKYMKTELLTLTPAEFCAATNACETGAEFAKKFKTMSDVWRNCDRVDWLIWMLDALDAPSDEKVSRRFAVWCARNTPLVDGRTTVAMLTDPRSLEALAVAERFAEGCATSVELAAAWTAASTAASTAARSAASTAASTAARSAASTAASTAAWTAARSAASTAASTAAWTAAWTAASTAARSEAWTAEESAAWTVAESAARSAQAGEFRRVVGNPFI